MKKNTKIIIVIAIAVACAVVACIGIFNILSPQRATIYLFNADYSAGDQLTSSMLTPMQVDSSVYVAGAKGNISDRFVTSEECNEIIRSGDSLRIDVQEGMPLMGSMLSVTGGNEIEMSMRSDAIAITVSIDEITGITNDLTAGSRVNVYSTYGAYGTQLLLENMRVLSIHKNTSGVLKSATLETTNDEALKLVEAANKGKIYLGLINANGYQEVMKDEMAEKDEGFSVYDATELIPDEVYTESISEGLTDASGQNDPEAAATPEVSSTPAPSQSTSPTPSAAPSTTTAPTTTPAATPTATPAPTKTP